MKSLPESRFWTDIKWRLRQYSEEPDDLWKKISPSIPSRNDQQINAVGHAFTFLALFMLLFLFLFSTGGKAILLKEHDTEAVNPDRTKLLFNGNMSEGQKSTEQILLSEDEQTCGSLHTPLSRPRSKGNSSEAVNPIFFEHDLSEVAFNDFTFSTNHSDTERDFFATERDLKLSSAGLVPLLQSDSLLSKKRIKKPDVPESTINEKREKRKTTLSPIIYFSITPTLSYFKIVPNTTDDVMITGINQGNIFSSSRKGVEFESGFQKRLGRKLELFGGVSYSFFNQDISYHHLSGELGEISGSVKTEYKLYPTASTLRSAYSVRQAGVNAGIFYEVKGGRLSHQIGAGVQYLTGSVIISSEGSTKKTKLYLFNYMLMYRMQYLINQRLNCYVQPGLNYSLKSNQFADEPFEVRPYKVGIGLGIIYRF